MSVVSQERNVLKKRFPNKALIEIEDTLYSTSLLNPSARNRRLFKVHEAAVVRLNSTMDRHIRGNSQIFYTMVYKDQPREELIRKFWNGLIKTPEFQALPPVLQRLELEQAKKLGPTSRFTIEKLFDGFINHIDEEAKVRNKRRSEWEEAFEPFCKWIASAILKARLKYPEDTEKYFSQFYDLQKAFDNLNKDKAGGDPYFIRVDRDVAGVTANELYFRDAQKVRTNPLAEVYYEMFIRVQNKGNTFIPDDIEPVHDLPESNLWLDEKNRVVQGDSRSWQFLLKNMSDIVTKIPKLVDPNFVGWDTQERKNIVIGNYMKEFQGKYLFDSFDATDYDASTDPFNFAMGIKALYRILELVGLKPDSIVQLDHTIRHYLNDATLTPWGAFERDSTPSGHNLTGPNGTLTNLYRCFVQTARLFNVSFEQFVTILTEYAEKDIPLFMAVGDDATTLRDLKSTPESVALENDSDGFKQGDLTKLVLSGVYLHFLQFGYYLEGSYSYMGFYPVSRVAEHGLFQEKADQYTAEEVSSSGLVQNLNNARFNPCQDYAIDFFMEGDKKYRLGSDIGVLNLFKKASRGRSVAETLGREWDPSYSGMSWEKFGETISGTARKIESRRGKFNS